MIFAWMTEDQIIAASSEAFPVYKQGAVTAFNEAQLVYMMGMRLRETFFFNRI